MGNSVAGKIRIDLIAQTAQFTAGLREGGQALGSFHEQFEKLDRSFKSKKSVEARAESMAKAWQDAMKETRIDDFFHRKELFSRDPNSDLISRLGIGIRDFGENEAPGTIDQANRNRMRWRNMIPWGNSMRVELSREAAETAALLGKESKSLKAVFSSSLSDLAGAGFNAAGFGGIFGKAISFASSPMGAATIGVTAIASHVAHVVREHDQIARDVRNYAQQFGLSSESASRLMGSGIDDTAIARVQRSFTQQNKEQMQGFGALGLNPEKLRSQDIKTSLLEIREAFQKIPNASEKALIAFDLFGRGGYATIATLEKMKDKMDMLGEHEIIHAADIERVKAWDKSLKGAKNTLDDLGMSLGRVFGSESGLGTHMARGIELLGPLFRGDFEGLDSRMFRYQREDFNIEHANRVAMLKAGVDRKAAFGLESEYQAGRLTREEYDQEASKLIDALQINTQRIEQEADTRAAAAKKLQDANDELFELENGSDAAKRMKHERELIEGGFSDVRGMLGSSTPLDREMEKYDAAVERRKQMEKTKEDDREADRLHKLGLGPQDKYNEEMSLVNRLYESKKLSEDDYAGLKKRYLKEYYDAEKSERSRALDERFREEDSFKKRLGIRDPMDEYLRDVARVYDAGRRGEINGKDVTEREGQLRGRLAEELFGHPSEINPVAMMTAGSAELHTLMAKANTPDPKIAILQETNRLISEKTGQLMEIMEKLAAGGNVL